MGHSKDSTKRVAVLVHNEVFKDARVRKEAASLVKAGLDVDVFGITRDWTDHPSTVEGARVELLLDKPGTRRSKLKALLRKRSVEGLAVVALAALFGWCLSTGSLEWLLRLILAVGLGAIWIAGSLKRNSARRRKLFLATRGLLAGSLSLATLSSIFFQVLSPWDVLWMGLGLWALFRFDPTPSRLQSKAVAATREGRYNSLAKLLSDRVLAKDYDVVHCHDIIALIAGGIVKRTKPSIVLVWDAHEIYEDMANGRPEDRELVRKILRREQSLVDHFITINDSIAGFYADNYSLPKAQVVMNATRSAGAIDYDGRLHRAAGIKPDRKVLIFQGGLAPHRGISELIEAVPNLPEGWSIVIMGWGNLQDDVQRAVDALSGRALKGESPLALIPPAPQEELAEWTAGATLGAILYEDIGLNHLYCTPNKLWEYPNAGVPIVATGLVEMRGMIEKWGTGFLLPTDFTAQDLINLIGSLTDEELVSAKERCAIFSSEMSWERFEPSLLACYGLPTNEQMATPALQTAAAP